MTMITNFLKRILGQKTLKLYDIVLFEAQYIYQCTDKFALHVHV